MTIISLSWITQGKKENLKFYIDRFTQVVVEVEEVEECLKCWKFENGSLQNNSFGQNPGRKKACIVKEILNKAQPFIHIEENLNTQFDNLGTTYANPVRSFEKDSHRRIYELGLNTHGWYDKYTPLNALQEKKF